ncbi:hypothetical protein TNCV_2636821 [Trichonephila clavipes]|uniref:Uncharacterized protein n=1 Tax=Trichonephila clavipes TaxID=2585209 RepID=A0A8X6RCD8_TRICX|nr:hypothetical protein TNCV_2636821 [Trichonephila clavipes]
MFCCTDYGLLKRFNLACLEYMGSIVCFLQWLLAHVEITGNENTDKLAGQFRNNNENFVNVTLLNANAVTNIILRVKSIPVKHQLCNTSVDRLTAKAIARLLQRKEK